MPLVAVWRIIYNRWKQHIELGSWFDGLDQSFSNKDIEKQSDWGYLLGIKPKVLAKGLDEDCEGKKET